MIPLIYIRELEFLHLDMPEIHCAHLTANEREGCLDRIKRFACLGYPLMSVSSRKNTDDTCLPLTIGSHEAIDHLTDCLVAAVGNDQLIPIFGSFGCQFHRVPTM